MNVWVLSASKYESIREVAEAIAERLGAASHQVPVLDAGEIEGFNGADAVVLGSAISAGHWLKAARKLLDEHADELASRPMWLFSVGPLRDPPMGRDVGPEGSQRRSNPRTRARTRCSRAARPRPAQPRRAADGESAACPRGRLPRLERDLARGGRCHRRGTRVGGAQGCQPEGRVLVRHKDQRIADDAVVPANHSFDVVGSHAGSDP
jgi:Flavodoxin domain